jgi:cobalt-zinc-cadmium efflux system protein
LALTITGVLTVVEFIGGYFSDSLALMSDAGHMLTDTLALGLSLGAVRIALRPPTEEQTFGFLRAEILAALVNGAVLVVVTVVIFYEAVRRILEPPEVEAPLMLVIALAGLAANGVGIYVLRDRLRTNLNVRGAFLHMFADLLSSVGVIAGALMILLFNVMVADPILSLLIGVIILAGAWRLVTQSTSILLESVPSHIKLQEVKKTILGVEGVSDVHDLHVWTVVSGKYALSAHLVVADRLMSNCSGVVSQCEELLLEKYSIDHTTFQLECKACAEDSCAFQPGK